MITIALALIFLMANALMIFIIVNTHSREMKHATDEYVLLAIEQKKMLARACEAEYQRDEALQKLAALQAERAKVASGKLNCAECGSALAKW